MPPAAASSSPTKVSPNAASGSCPKESSNPNSVSDELAVSGRRFRQSPMAGPGGHGPVATFPAGSATLVAKAPTGGGGRWRTDREPGARDLGRVADRPRPSGLLPAYDRSVVAIVFVAGKWPGHSTDGAGRRAASVPIRAAASGLRGGECESPAGKSRMARMRPLCRVLGTRRRTSRRRPARAAGGGCDGHWRWRPTASRSAGPAPGRDRCWLPRVCPQGDDGRPSGGLRTMASVR